jgi:hypothetical protein
MNDRRAVIQWVAIVVGITALLMGITYLSVLLDRRERADAARASLETLNAELIASMPVDVACEQVASASSDLVGLRIRMEVTVDEHFFARILRFRCPSNGARGDAYFTRDGSVSATNAAGNVCLVGTVGSMTLTRGVDQSMVVPLGECRIRAVSPAPAATPPTRRHRG